MYAYTETEARWSLLQTVTSELWSLGEKKGEQPPSRAHQGIPRTGGGTPSRYTSQGPFATAALSQTNERTRHQASSVKLS